jgi:hypothetical protein
MPGVRELQPLTVRTHATPDGPGWPSGWVLSLVSLTVPRPASTTSAVGYNHHSVGVNASHSRPAGRSRFQQPPKDVPIPADSRFRASKASNQVNQGFARSLPRYKACCRERHTVQSARSLQLCCQAPPMYPWAPQDRAQAVRHDEKSQIIKPNIKPLCSLPWPRPCHLN